MVASSRPNVVALLLLLQLTLVSGARVWVYHVAIAAKSWEMPVQTAPEVHEEAPPTPAYDCALMAICTPGAPAVFHIGTPLRGPVAIRAYRRVLPHLLRWTRPPSRTLLEEPA